MFMLCVFNLYAVLVFFVSCALFETFLLYCCKSWVELSGVIEKTYCISVGPSLEDKLQIRAGQFIPSNQYLDYFKPDPSPAQNYEESWCRVM